LGKNQATYHVPLISQGAFDALEATSRQAVTAVAITLVYATLLVEVGGKCMRIEH
jgi:hypothetical protein